MKTILVYLLVLFCFFGCASNNTMVSKLQMDNMNNDEIAIRKLYSENVAAQNACDISSLSHFYEKDAIQLPPDLPALIGWESIESSLRNEFKGISIESTTKVLEITISSNWAYARGTYRTIITPLGGSKQTELKGNWLDILRRQQDGSWKIARSTWTNKE
jgi:uncharacterized protein (TIGR02246 family)